jgi:twitching motility protein PilT
MTIDDLLRTAVERRASDLHLTVGLPPQVRIDGRLVPMGVEKLSDETVQVISFQMLDASQLEQFRKNKEIDSSYSIKGLSRFRVNLYRQRSSVAAAIRIIPFTIPTIEQLELPEALKLFSKQSSGLFIVSGPTGCGKSTTLAAMVDQINSTRNCHILCIEDPIEYLHRHRKATVNQRELGIDTTSFKEALRHAVREDPDVILLGEMRDLETMSAALTLAETGHLVLTTLHTSDVVHAIYRIVDVFPPYQQTQVRIQLSLVLLGIVVQQLLPRASGQGRIPACEVMGMSPAISNLIRENDLHQLRSLLQTSSQEGMCTMNQSLAKLFNHELVSWDEVARRATDPQELSSLVKTTHKR